MYTSNNLKSDQKIKTLTRYLNIDIHIGRYDII